MIVFSKGVTGEMVSTQSQGLNSFRGFESRRDNERMILI
jgi:hypothetical protein